MTYNEKQNDSDMKKQQSGDLNKKNASGNINEKPESRNAGSKPSSGQRPDQQRSDIKNGSQDTRSKGNM